MRKSIIALSVFFLLLGCKKKEKPFIVVGKNATYDYKKGKAYYYFQDANGNTYEFSDDVNKYSVGDTLK